MSFKDSRLWLWTLITWDNTSEGVRGQSKLTIFYINYNHSLTSRKRQLIYQLCNVVLKHYNYWQRNGTDRTMSYFIHSILTMGTEEEDDISYTVQQLLTMKWNEKAETCRVLFTIHHRNGGHVRERRNYKQVSEVAVLSAVLNVVEYEVIHRLSCNKHFFCP